MDDYEGLLNRVARQLVYSGFTSQRQSRSSSTQPQIAASGSASRIHKTASGRNSPARRSSYNNRGLVASERHSTPPGIMPPKERTTQSLLPLELQSLEPIRPHSWHKSGFNYPPFSNSDYSLEPASSSFPDTTFDWSLNNASDINQGHGQDRRQISLGEPWSTPPNLAPMDENPYFYNALGFGYDQPLGSFEIFSATTSQQPIDHGLNAPLPQLRNSEGSFGTPSALPLSFGAYYGSAMQPVSELDFSLLYGEDNFTSEDSDPPGVAHQTFEHSPFEQQIPASPDEELIGLGLFDKAEDTARQTRGVTQHNPDNLFSIFTPPTGKGLRLEETWQPPSEGKSKEDHDDDDDDEEDEEEDDQNDSYYEQQLVTPTDPIPFLEFPLHLSEERYLYYDEDGFPTGLMESRQKGLHTQATYQAGWFLNGIDESA